MLSFYKRPLPLSPELEEKRQLCMGIILVVYVYSYKCIFTQQYCLAFCHLDIQVLKNLMP